MVPKGVRACLFLLTCLLVADAARAIVPERSYPVRAGLKWWWAYSPITRVEPDLLAVARPGPGREDLRGAYRSLAIGVLARKASKDLVPVLVVPQSLFLLISANDVASFDNLTPALVTTFVGGRLDLRAYDPVLPADAVATLPPLRQHEPLIATLADAPHPGPLALLTDEERRWIYILPEQFAAKKLRAAE